MSKPLTVSAEERETRGGFVCLRTEPPGSLTKAGGPGKKHPGLLHTSVTELLPLHGTGVWRRDFSSR